MTGRSRRRWLGLAALSLFLSALGVVAGVHNAGADPLVRRATLIEADWPADTPPMRLVLMTDTHVAGPDNPPARLERIVRQVNALRPDLILVAGDFHSGKRTATRLYSAREQTAPLRLARARLGTIAVLGNHDYWHDARAVIAGLRAANVTILRNNAVRRGPIIIGGVDDVVTRHAHPAATIAAMAVLGEGPRILLTHSPDIVPDLSTPVDLVLAGHTHCGQIAFPLIGALSYSSHYGARFACGDMTDRGQRVIVSAGIGTSVLPMRFGAPPDIWLITIRGPDRQ